MEYIIVIHLPRFNLRIFYFTPEKYVISEGEAHKRRDNEHNNNVNNTYNSISVPGGADVSCDQFGAARGTPGPRAVIISRV